MSVAKAGKVSSEKPAPASDAEPVSTSALTKQMLDPNLRHGDLAKDFAKGSFGEAWDPVSPWEYAAAIRNRGDAAAGGDLTEASAILMAQARTLDAIFTEMARRMALNMREHLPATETYGRLAFKAQANSRATIEALAKLHQPREQTVRHVHVNQGGQAVIADEFHHHAGGLGNGQSSEQPHGPSASAAGTGAPLLGTDASGDSVPVSGGEGQSAVSDARRKRQRRAAGQCERVQTRGEIG